MNEERLSRLMSNLPGMAYRCKMDETWEMLFVSDGCLNLTGYPGTDLLHNAALSYNDLIHPEDRDYVWQKVNHAVEQREHFTLTYRIIDKSGELKYVWEQGLAVYDEKDKVDHLEGFVTDISERVLSERKLMESEERFRGVLENISLIGVMLDRSGDLFFANDFFLSLAGWRRSEAIGKNWFKTFLPERTRDEFEGAFRTAIETNQFRSNFQSPILARNGRTRMIRWSATVHLSSEGEFLFLTCIGEDITEQVEYIEKLNESTMQLRALSHHLDNIRENERANIAREIHDEFGQVLTVLKMNLSFLEEELKAQLSPEKMKAPSKELTSMKQLIDTSVKNLRKLVMSLRPEELEKLGLEATLTNLVREFQQRTGIECKYSFGMDDEKIDHRQALVIYRIIQELLTNAAKHSRATTVEVTTRTLETKHLIIVSDNGIGIDPKASQTEPSFGLLGIRERASMYNGQVAIKSKLRKGTTVEVHLPFANSQTLNQG